MSAYFQPVIGGTIASRVGAPASIVKQAGLVGSAVRGLKSFGHSRMWLAALLCTTVALIAGEATAVIKFSPLNVGSVELVADAGKVQSVNSQTGAVVLAASDVGAVATNDFASATNALAEAIAKAEPGDYAAVSNAAMTALQPAATNATFSNAVNAAASALVKAKLESLDRAKSSIGETIAALQSIYETETK